MTLCVFDIAMLPILFHNTAIVDAEFGITPLMKRNRAKNGSKGDKTLRRSSKLKPKN